jgi:hypothetical protein
MVVLCMVSFQNTAAMQHYFGTGAIWRREPLPIDRAMAAMELAWRITRRGGNADAAAALWQALCPAPSRHYVNA